MITLEEAKNIARKVYKGADSYSEYERGYHFFRKADDLFMISDPGIAISKKDGRIYVGYAAREFLHG